VSASPTFSPAKINLFLAITGRRADGFHDLVSVVAPLEFGDTLWVEPKPEAGHPKPEGRFTLECDDPALPTDASNLVLRAARAFAGASGWRGGAHFRLEKRIPPGAGLGGGSSNAVAVLRALNQIAGGPFDAAQLAGLAAGLGSDCPLFVHAGPVVLRGRGEQVAPLPAAAARLRGRRVLLFKPGIGVSTPWAYARMAAGAPRHYLPAAGAEARLAAWLDGGARAESLLFNNMEEVVFAKFLALPVLLDALRGEFDLAARMSGSGSACFALLQEATPVPAVIARIREFWGPAAFVTETKIS
jgi:4-diphosphocytidyl-2-C-methyl-D-erythritol kinase